MNYSIKSKLKNYFLLLTLIISSFNLLKTSSSNISVDDFFDPNNNSELPSDDNHENCITAETILPLITGDTAIIDVAKLLKNNIYIKTQGPVRTRSLLDEPSLIPYYFDNDYWVYTAQLFFNYSPKVYLTKNSPYIKNYIDLTNKNIVSQLSESEFIKANIPEVLGLFHDIKLKQYRAGLMTGAAYEGDNFNFNFRLPLYYLLEHFYLNEDEIKNIKNSPFLKFEESSIGTTGEAEVRDFVFKHLVSDKVGIGDTRLDLLFNIFESKKSKIWLGLQTTIPTAVAFKSGIIGSKFKKNNYIPEFNIKKLFELYLCSTGPGQAREAEYKIKDNVTKFLVGALDKLSSILINEPLGNGGHFSLGPEIDIQYDINYNWSSYTYFVVRYFVPKKENRFFLKSKKDINFNRDYEDEALAEENLIFINDQLINTLYPTCLKVNVKPGPLVQFNTSIFYDTQHFHAALGIDYWQVSKEKFGPLYQSDSFDINKAIRPSARQTKLFGSIGYYGDYTTSNIGYNLLFTWDSTIEYNGIGQNYTIGLYGSLDF